MVQDDPLTPLDGEILPPGAMSRDERLVRTRFWPKLRRVAGKIPFAEDLAAAVYCALDPATPARVRGVLLAAAAYFIMPADLIPDFIAGLGFTDDATVLMAAIGLVSGHIKDHHRAQARAALLISEPAENP